MDESTAKMGALYRGAEHMEPDYDPEYRQGDTLAEAQGIPVFPAHYTRPTRISPVALSITNSSSQYSLSSSIGVGSSAQLQPAMTLL